MIKTFEGTSATMVPNTLTTGNATGIGAHVGSAPLPRRALVARNISNVVLPTELNLELQMSDESGKTSLRTHETGRSGRRLAALDALRGIAAVAVVFFHLEGAFLRAPQPWMPGWLSTLFQHGHLGVNIFFAISGFVIAMSVKHEADSWAYAGRFTIRRSIRLDPPMWMAIAVEMALIFVGLKYMGNVSSAELPSVPQVLTNMVYLQEFFGYAHISPVFWTLCYEIQFYLTFVFVLVLGAKFSDLTTKSAGSSAVFIMFTALFVASLLASAGLISSPPRGVGLHRWNEFFLGALTYWVCTRRTRPWMLVVGTSMVVAATLHTGRALEATILIITCLTCALSYLRPSFDALANAKVWQRLGLISYSVYLYHGSLGYRTVSLGQHFLGSTLSSVTGPLLWVFSLGVAVGGSAILWYFVERPTVTWSRQISLKPAPTTRLSTKQSTFAVSAQTDDVESFQAP